VVQLVKSRISLTSATSSNAWIHGSNPRSDVEIGHNSMIACHLSNIAFRLGRRVEWDVEKERFVNDPEAQKTGYPRVSRAVETGQLMAHGLSVS
jgi:hypothetical protein